MNRCCQGRILGVFLGDEVCECGVPFSNLSSVADAAKAHLQKIGRGNLEQRLGIVQRDVHRGFLVASRPPS